MESTGQNLPSGPSSLSPEDWAAFAEEFMTNLPDGYYVETGPKKGQITLSQVSNGFRFSVIMARDDGSAFPGMVSNALLDLSCKAIKSLHLEQEIKVLKEQLALARESQFGTSSEQQPSQQKDGPEEKQPEDDVEEVKPLKPPKLSTVQTESNAGRKPLSANLPRDEARLELPEDTRCSCCDGKLKQVGEDVTEKLIHIPEQYRVRRERRAKYFCYSCGKYVIAPAPKSMVPKSNYASPEFLAHIANMKYQLGLPFYRQEMNFRLSGLPFNRTTLANLMIGCADRLTPLIMLLKDELLSQIAIHADETIIQVLKEKGRDPQTQSYLWQYRSAASAAHQVVLFDYQETRGGKHPKAFLETFNRYLHADGYSGYNNIPGIVRVACMAHIRRKFVEATKAIPAGHAEHSHAQQAVNMIGELYGIEKKLKGLPPEEIYEARQRESIPILQRLKKWLDDMKQRAAPRELLGKAVHYAVEQWPAMMRYVEDGRLAIDNNIAEREIKQVVIGRKNWLFADMPEGAYTIAVMYSLVQTARANGLNPYEYLRHVFATLPNLATAEEVKQLLPWNMNLITEMEPMAA